MNLLIAGCGDAQLKSGPKGWNPAGQGVCECANAGESGGAGAQPLGGGQAAMGGRSTAASPSGLIQRTSEAYTTREVCRKPAFLR